MLYNCIIFLKFLVTRVPDCPIQCLAENEQILCNFQQVLSLVPEVQSECDLRNVKGSRDGLNDFIIIVF